MASAHIQMEGTEIEENKRRVNGDILKYAMENGMIDIAYVQKKMEMQKREELLNKHPYSIWETKEHKWATYLPDKEKGRRLKVRLKLSSLEDDIIAYWRQETENPSIKDVFNEWNDRRLNMKKITSSTHQRNIQVFNRHFSEFGSSKIKTTTVEEISEFLEEQIPKHNLKAKAFGNLKSITRGFLKRAKRRKLITYNVEEFLAELDVSDCDFSQSVNDDFDQVFLDHEIKLVTGYLKEHQDIINLGILLLFATGLRVGELVCLKPSDVGDRYIHVAHTETRYVGEDGHYIFEIKDNPKTPAGIRDVVISDESLWIIKAIRKSNPFGEYLFMKNGKRLNTSQVRKRLYYLCNKLNIRKKCPHKIRKTYGTILMDNHVDEKMILSQMGHTEIATSEKYYHKNRRSNNERADIISSIPELMIK